MEKSDFRKISELEEIPLGKLHIQYIPMSRLEQFYTKTNGHNLMSLVYSPHVEIMRIFDEHGFDIYSLMNSRYAKERLHRRKLGMREWTKKHLLKHFKTRYKTFKSIKEYGFIQGKCWDKKKQRDRSILVFKKPFWNTRFKLKIPDIKGLEIANGAGRCSAMYALGYKTIPGNYIEDAKPGTKKCEHIERRFK